MTAVAGQLAGRGVLSAVVTTGPPGPPPARRRLVVAPPPPADVVPRSWPGRE